MAVNKVEINGKIELDLTTDTVTANLLAMGTTAHNAAGQRIVGTLVPGGESGYTPRTAAAYTLIAVLAAGVSIVVPDTVSSAVTVSAAGELAE